MTLPLSLRGKYQLVLLGAGWQFERRRVRITIRQRAQSGLRASRRERGQVPRSNQGWND